VTNKQLWGKVIIKGNIKVETGLAIGGSKAALDIGGVDTPVIKGAKGVPYIPGSSLKGKIRSLLEQSKYPLRNNDLHDGKGKFDDNLIIHIFEDGTVDDIIQIFGAPDYNEPVRGIFRDAFLDEEYFEKNKANLFKNLELDYTEDKIENRVDRISARAMPRHLERVPTGTLFNFEILLDLYSVEDKELVKTLLQGLSLLEDDYLGGSGSRGSGKVTFEIDLMNWRDISYYKGEAEEIKLREKFRLKDIKNIDWVTDVFSKITL